MIMLAAAAAASGRTRLLKLVLIYAFGLVCILGLLFDIPYIPALHFISADGYKSLLQLAVKIRSPADILYWNRHHACSANIRHVAQKLGLTLDEVAPFGLLSYGTSDSESRAVIRGGYVDVMCSRYSVIIVADTIPDARPFLMQETCQATIILEITNRFTVMYTAGSEDETSFIELVRQRILHPGSRPPLIIVANNPYEEYFFKSKTGLWNLSIPLIRPLGIAPVPVLDQVARDPDTPHTVVASYNPYLFDAFKEHGITHVKKVPHYYGGPKTLALYRALVFVPYQVSVMKMYEGIAAGAVTLIPSPAFYAELMSYWNPDNTREVVKMQNWTLYVEHYCPDFKDFFFHFDSWEHLKQIVEPQGAQQVVIQMDDRVKRGMNAMLEWKQKGGLEAWKSIFRQTPLKGRIH